MLAETGMPCFGGICFLYNPLDTRQLISPELCFFGQEMVETNAEESL